jgi:hypothetical protein
MASFLDYLKQTPGTLLDFTGLPTLANAAAESMARSVKLDKYGNPINEMDTSLTGVYTDPDYIRKVAQNSAMLGASAATGGTARAGFTGFRAGLGARTAAGMTPGTAAISSIPSAVKGGAGYYGGRVTDIVRAPGIRGKAGAAAEVASSAVSPILFGSAVAASTPGSPLSPMSTSPTGASNSMSVPDFKNVQNAFEAQFAAEYLKRQKAKQESAIADLMKSYDSSVGSGASSASTGAFNLQSAQVKEGLRDALMGINQQVSGGQADLASTLAGLGMSQSPAQLAVGQESIQQQGVAAEQQTRMQARNKLTELLAQLTQQRQNEANARFNAEQAARFNATFGGTR